GPALLARITSPQGLAIGPDGSLYIEEMQNSWRVRRVDPLGFITTVAGTGVAGHTGDGGPATAATISPQNRAIAVGKDGSLYIGEFKFVRKVTPDGIIRTIAGVAACPGFFCDTGDGGPALNAQLNVLGGIGIGPDGSVYIEGPRQIRRITPDGIINNFAGNG